MNRLLFFRTSKFEVRVNLQTLRMIQGTPKSCGLEDYGRRFHLCGSIIMRLGLVGSRLGTSRGSYLSGIGAILLGLRAGELPSPEAEPEPRCEVDSGHTSHGVR